MPGNSIALPARAFALDESESKPGEVALLSDELMSADLIRLVYVPIRRDWRNETQLRRLLWFVRGAGGGATPEVCALSAT